MKLVTKYRFSYMNNSTQHIKFTPGVSNWGNSKIATKIATKMSGEIKVR